VARKARCALGISPKDGLIRLRVVLLHPGKERRAEIEAYSGIVVDDVAYDALCVQDTRRCVGRITLCRNPLVPIVVRMRRILNFYDFKPRVFPRWLIKMPMYTDISLHAFSTFIFRICPQRCPLFGLSRGL